MKKYILSEAGTFYKANLHCHSTISDGDLTCEELKDHYKALGYSVLAYTDHEVLIDHSDLNDENFLTITSYEMAVNAEDSFWENTKTCHINLYARDPHNTTQVFYSPDSLFGNTVRYKDKVKYKGDYAQKEYTPEYLNLLIAEANKNGFIVSYNHPQWSLETYEEYANYKGVFAMEVRNHGCALMGLDISNTREYDDMLRAGEQLYCLATDDNHHANQMGGGWVMIKAPSLEYEAIMQSLENGNFYSSTGPEIFNLYIEDGEAVIECSPVKSICLSGQGRRNVYIKNADGAAITSARVPLDERDGYFRFEITDENGEKAYTNAVFVKDWK